MNELDWLFYLLCLTGFLPIFIAVGAGIGIAIYFIRKKRNTRLDLINAEIKNKELEQEQLERNARFISARTSNKD